MSTRIKTRKGWVPVAGSYISIEHDCTIPVGVIVSYYGTVAPDGWFICDGTNTTGTENELAAKYPKLYKVLGNSNILPDLRECVLVGAGQNSTDTIAVHDVYTVGEFKDDRMRSHRHSTGSINVAGPAGFTKQVGEATWTSGINYYTTTAGDVTHGKQKGVNFIIKAAECIDISGAGTSTGTGTGTNIVAPVPDWANSVNVKISSVNSSDKDTLFTYTTPEDGYVSFLDIEPQHNEITGNGETIAVGIQDKLIYQQYIAGTGILSIPALPVSKGDVIKLTGFSSTNNKQKLVFTPYKQR